MDIPKYDGNIHPDEWINDIQKYLKLRYTVLKNFVIHLKRIFLLQYLNVQIKGY
ncbi:hypothetical protein RhiirC2_744065 [Rhizophagus irregularis]|uniref:Uncharacterized protein n=1 Tax=Rhizophagus irregularis TaxID=588596 RepID=A0A2N1NCX8_9GLOM|nr:hypothetical protein RhiirC2_744065 [Rhizophagus irregularis]